MTITTLGAGQPVLVTTTFTPASLSSLNAWYDAQNSGSITQVASVVSQWNDLSSGGVNVSQATAGNRPTYSATSLNSRPGITFTKSLSQNLAASALPFATFADFTVFIVFNAATIVGYNTLYALGAAGDEFDVALRPAGPPNSAIIYMSSGPSTEGDTNGNITTSAPHYVAWKRDASNVVTFRIDGVDDTKTVTVGTAPVTIGTALTFVGGDGGGGENSDSTIGEIIVYGRLLNSTEIGQVESYLKTRWGL
jgi:hypothetical protein